MGILDVICSSQPCLAPFSGDICLFCQSWNPFSLYYFICSSLYFFIHLLFFILYVAGYIFSFQRDGQLVIVKVMVLNLQCRILVALCSPQWLMNFVLSVVHFVCHLKTFLCVPFSDPFGYYNCGNFSKFSIPFIRWKITQGKNHMHGLLCNLSE